MIGSLYGLCVNMRCYAYFLLFLSQYGMNGEIFAPTLFDFIKMSLQTHLIDIMVCLFRH